MTNIIGQTIQGQFQLIDSSGGPTINGRTVVVNDLGQVSFLGTGGIYVFEGSTITSLVRNGTLTPDGTKKFGGSFHTEDKPFIFNNQGQVAFQGNDNLLTSLYGGIYLAGPSGITTIAQPGDLAPIGGTFYTLTGFSAPALNDSGQIAFLAQTTDSPDKGIFSTTTQGIKAIAVKGDIAPGGGTFSDFRDPLINNSGQIAFVGKTGNTDGIYLASGGNLTKLVRSGEPAPGGGVFDSFWYESPAFNNFGKVAIAATFDKTSGGGIYLMDDSIVRKIARSGETNSLGNILQTFFKVSLNDSNEVVFLAREKLKNDTGVYFGNVDGIKTVAVENTPAPGGGSFYTVYNPIICNAGYFAFVGKISSSVSALYYGNSQSLIRLVTPLDQILGNTIASIDSSMGLVDFINNQSPMNAKGQLAFLASAGPRGGIFIFSPSSSDSYASWKENHFATNINDPSVSGDLADPDLDQIPNLIEYAMGTDPNSFDSFSTQWAVSDGLAKLQYQRSTHSPDVTLRISTTEILTKDAVWTTNGVTHKLLSEDGQVQKWEASVSADNSNTKFVRLEVSR